MQTGLISSRRSRKTERELPRIGRTTLSRRIGKEGKLTSFKTIQNRIGKWAPEDQRSWQEGIELYMTECFYEPELCNFMRRFDNGEMLDSGILVLTFKTVEHASWRRTKLSQNWRVVEVFGNTLKVMDANKGLIAHPSWVEEKSPCLELSTC